MTGAEVYPSWFGTSTGCPYQWVASAKRPILVVNAHRPHHPLRKLSSRIYVIISIQQWRHPLWLQSNYHGWNLVWLVPSKQLHDRESFTANTLRLCNLFFLGLTYSDTIYSTVPVSTLILNHLLITDMQTNSQEMFVEIPSVFSSIWVAS